jgi:hypothetical protein
MNHKFIEGKTGQIKRPSQMTESGFEYFASSFFFLVLGNFFLPTTDAGACTGVREV